jgi:hypothetical protein
MSRFSGSAAIVRAIATTAGLIAQNLHNSFTTHGALRAAPNTGVEMAKRIDWYYHRKG